MKNPFHKEILKTIQKQAGTPTQHTFSDTYLGNNHPRYPISAPALRKIAAEWMRAHRDLGVTEFADLLTSLANGESSTEKVMVGILLDNSTNDQRRFDPRLFDTWLDQLVGWAEVDSVCTGKYTVTEITGQWKKWKPLIQKFSKSKNINKRRASLVLFCSPLRHVNDKDLGELAFAIVENLKHEKEIIITRAISWILRSMEKHHRKELEKYLEEYSESLPRIAVRETMTKLKTGVKGGIRKSKR